MKNSRENFTKLQAQWFAHYGTKIQSYFITPPHLERRVHILECGQGEPVLMLHGGNAFAALWEPLLNLLQPHLHLYAPDRFGCGLSEAIDYNKIDLKKMAITFIDDFLEINKIEKISLIGNSLGGYWALLYAMTRPERIHKIALIGAPAGLTPPPAIIRLLSVPYLNKMINAALFYSKNSIELLFKRAWVNDVEILPKQIFPLVEAGLALPGVQSNWTNLLTQTLTYAGMKPAYSLKNELKKVPQPTLLIWGDKDPFGSVDLAKETVKQLPHAQLEIIQNASHMPWLDHPIRVAKLLAGFLS